MRITRFATYCLPLFLLCLGAPAAKAQKKGDVIYKTDFDSKRAMKDWHGTKKYHIAKKKGITSVRITSRKSELLRLRLPAKRLQGCKIAVHARFRSQKISVPPFAWNGIKVMMHVSMPWTDIWPQAQVDQNAPGWNDASFSSIIPAGADSAEIVIGLENVSGRIWFDNLEVTIAEEPRRKPAKSPAGQARYTGHKESRLRGAMIPTFISDSDLVALGRWGANQVRWQFAWQDMPCSPDTASPEVFQQWINNAMSHVDKLLPICREMNIKILIDMHTLPGGYTSDHTSRIFREKEWQQAFRTIWRNIALKYANEKAIWGYDLANEPKEGIIPPDVMNWHELATATAQDIRTVDTIHAIIVESSPNGSPDGLAQMNPIPVPGIVYSIHMYVPEFFTMQFVDNYSTEVTHYPGQLGGKEWNKTTLRSVLQPVIDWQNEYNTQIYIGEFSCARWAPGESAYYYLRDCIELFEEQGWDWSYHAFREWHGWSVEHTTDRNNSEVSPTPTLRQKLLMDWYNKNKGH